MSATSVSTTLGFPGVPNWMQDEGQHRRLMAGAINRLNQGKINSVLDVTLTASTGATVITDRRIGFNSAVTPLMAMSRSAALAIAAGIWFDAPMSSTESTSATIVAHHTASSALDQKIRFGILG